MDNGRKVFLRSKKPLVSRGEIKKVIENQDELDSLKYLGRTMEKMREDAASMKNEKN
jgi:hypothetical protein